MFDMENEVLHFNIGVGGDDNSLAIVHSEDNNDDFMSDTPISPLNNRSFGGQMFVPEEGLDLEPYMGMEFESEEAAKAYYNSYARRVGFSTRVSSSRRSKRDGAIIQREFVCAKEGFRNMNEKRTKDRELKRPRTVTRVGCKAFLAVKIQDAGRWAVSGFVKEHNHELVPPDQVHCLRSHRQISGPAKTLIDTLQAAGMGPHRIMLALIKEYGGISRVGFTEVDCKNYMRNNRRKNLEGDLHPLMDYLRKMNGENPAFLYAMQGDEHQGMSNVFWADPKARDNYTYFGDTVNLDTSYRTNRYRLPFVPFTGINHHGQPVLLGCAFLINESETSFIWLFKTWLMAMSGHPPISITTDYDEVIASAIKQVFPETRHRFCKWNIFKKCQEKLSHVFLHHPNFEADFHKCVNLNSSIDEFESSWASLVDRYDLMDHDWLQKVYSARRQWVPVYVRDTFFAEMSITQRSDTMNSYFDGYVNASTILNQFVKLYEKAIGSRNEKEMKADYDTMNTAPVLKTPSPMEKQASELYTRKLFARFQDELVGTLSYMASKAEDDGEITTYLVAKYGEEHKASYVKFNVLEMKATCSCQMFEFSGIPCRHVLAVFRVSNILTLPSHYILKRWTRNAKSSISLEDGVGDSYANYLESHTVRYSTLRHESFKFVDEGAKSEELYEATMTALKEASKRVALAAKNDGRTSKVNGRSKGRRVNTVVSEDQQEIDEDEMDKKIRELTEELDCANWKCDTYREHLLSVLKDMDNQKQQLSVEVQNIKLSIKNTPFNSV